MRFLKFPRLRNCATNDELCRAVNDISYHAEGVEREVMKELSAVISKIDSLGNELSSVRQAVESLKEGVGV